METEKHIPKIITEVGFDFDWDEKKVWELTVPTEPLPVTELSWHFDIPFWDENGGRYNVTPRSVIDHPDLHPVEFTRTMAADTTYPIDIMQQNGRWLILDGLHRLVKQVIQGVDTVSVRKIPRSMIPLIEKK